MFRRLVYALFFLCTYTAFSQKVTKPNILLITADDLNYDSLGCMGNPIKGLTPHLDKLASEGALFENCYISTPICGPSRNALYTGQHPQTNGYMGHGVQPPTWWKAKSRQLSKKSIASELYKAGYLTGVVGKHGTSWCKFDAKFCDLEQTGFGRDPSKYFSFVRDFLKRSKREGKPFYLTANTHDPHHYWARSKGETKKWFDQGIGHSNWQAYLNAKPYPDPLTQYKPEEIMLHPSYPDDSNFKKEATLYFDSVNRMDQVVGELLRALEESGMADNTIVLFLSDHGMPWQMGKWSLYPAGTKTPLIIRWPAQIKQSFVNKKSVISVVDIVPTLAELCNIPALPKVDGSSFTTLLNGNSKAWKRKAAYSCFNYMNNLKPYDQAAKTYTTDLYKKVEQYRPSRALNTLRFSYVWNGWSDGETRLPKEMGGKVSQMLKKYSQNQQDKSYPDYKEKAEFLKFKAPEELYDIVKDPGCRNNLAKNPEYQTVLKNFRQDMRNILQATNDHELENFQRLMN
ncbi:MAG: sulfatase [Lentisphaerales bacterium]|nr:sulfatase [Lentisphaerales bacterium]